MLGKMRTEMVFRDISSFTKKIKRYFILQLVGSLYMSG